MNIKLGVMKEALLKAEVVNEKGKMTKEAKRKLRKWKNRFGDYALFEFWDVNKWPHLWYETCGFCGKRLGSTKIQVQLSKRVKLFICWDCYIYGKQNQAMEGLK